MQVMERFLKHAVDDWAWSICGCRARCDECEPLGLLMIGVCQSVDVRHGACSKCLSMIGLGRSVDAKHGAWSGCLSMIGFSRSVDERHDTMRGTHGVHAATVASWLSECILWRTVAVTSLLDYLGNQGLCMRTSTRICLSCSSALIRASLVLSRSEMHVATLFRRASGLLCPRALTAGEMAP